MQNEVIHFTNACLSHDDRNDAYQVLRKVTEFLPVSEVTQKLLRKVGKE
jgi:hypothetical protein